MATDNNTDNQDPVKPQGAIITPRKEGGVPLVNEQGAPLTPDTIPEVKKVPHGDPEYLGVDGKGDKTPQLDPNILQNMPNPLKEFSPNGFLEAVTNQEDFKGLVLSTGEVTGIAQFISNKVHEDVDTMSEGGLGVEAQERYGDLMVMLYADVMAKLGKPMDKVTGGSRAHREYVQSHAGIAELENAMTAYNMALSYDGFGNMPDDVFNALPEYRGTGLRDPNVIGFNEEEYESLGIFSKVGYNVFVGASEAGRRLAGVVGIESDKRLDADVAPVGEAAGFMTSLIIPGVAATKGIQGFKWAASAPKWLPGVLGWAAADYAITEREDGNLSTLLTESFPDNPIASNFVTEFLAFDGDDSELEIKLKAAVEGGIIDRVFAGALWAAGKGVKKGRKPVAWMGKEGKAMYNKVAANLPGTKVGKARAAHEKLVKDMVDALEALQFKTKEMVDKSMVADISEREMSNLAGKFDHVMSQEMFIDLARRAGETEDTISNLLKGLNPRNYAAMATSWVPGRDLMRILKHENDILVAKGNVLLAQIENIGKQSGSVGGNGKNKAMKKFIEEMQDDAAVEALQALEASKASAGKLTEFGEAQLELLKIRVSKIKPVESPRQKLQEQLDEVLDRLDARSEPVQGTDTEKLEGIANRPQGDDVAFERDIAEMNRLEAEIDKLDEVAPVPPAKEKASGLFTPGVKLNRAEDKVTAFLQARKNYDILKDTVNGAKLQASYYDMLKELKAGDASRKNIVVLNNIPTNAGKSVFDAQEYSRRLRANNMLSADDILDNASINTYINRLEESADILLSTDIPAAKGKATRSPITIDIDFSEQPTSFGDVPVFSTSAARGAFKDILMSPSAFPDVNVLPGLGRKRFDAKGDIVLPLPVIKSGVKRTADLVASQAVTNMLASTTQLTTAAASGAVVKPLLALEKWVGGLRVFGPYRNSIAAARIKELRGKAAAQFKGKAPKAGWREVILGGAVDVNGKALPLEGQSFWESVDIFLGRALSTPSKLDAEQLARSETSQGTFAEPGFVTELGFDPAGLSKVGTFAQTFESPVGRMLASTGLLVTEALPRMGLGALDEAYKTSTYWNTFSDSLVEGLVKAGGDTPDDILLNLHDNIMIRLTSGEEFARDLDSLAGEIHAQKIIPGASEEQILNALTKAHERGNQMARTVTLTQDVNRGLESAVRGLQTTSLGKIAAPFVRSAVNGLNMGLDRVPIVNWIYKDSRPIMLGGNRLTQEEQERLIGRNVVGAVAITASYFGAKYGIIKKEDKGSWEQTVLVLPRDDQDVEKYLQEAYEANSNQIDILASNAGVDDPIEFLRSNLPTDGATYQLDFERFSPVGTWLEFGLLLNELTSGSDPFDFEDGSDTSNKLTEFATGTAKQLLEDGLLGQVKDVTDTMGSPRWFVDKFLVQRFGIAFSPLHGLLNSPGEALGPITSADTATTYKGAIQKMWDKTIWARMGSDTPLARRRDSFGRVMVRAGRTSPVPFEGIPKIGDLPLVDSLSNAINVVGNEANLDIINEEFEFLGHSQRAPKTTSVPDFQGIDLTLFTFDKSLAPADISEKYEERIGDTVHAYEAWRAMVGTARVGGFEGAIIETQNIFKSSGYKKAKADMIRFSEEFADLPVEKRGNRSEQIQQARSFLLNMVKQPYQQGQVLASASLNSLSQYFVHKETGKTLAEAIEALRNVKAQGAQGVLELLGETK